ncbi:restriction endonuclease [Actinomadura logoneensis]|nr:restriction endonuclease [Actinomadura logoneensis]
MNTSLATTDRGRAFEELFCYLLDQVPGLRTRRNALNHYNSEEIDIAVANTRMSNGLACFPHLFLVECKNWSNPVDSSTIAEFIDKLENRRIELGVLVVANGVTGDPETLKSAYHKAAMAQSRGHRLIVLSLDDLLKASTTREFTELLVDRLLGVVVSGTFQLL